MTKSKNDAGPNPQLEQRLSAYFSLYATEAEYRASLQKQLVVKSSQLSSMQANRKENRFFEDLRFRPAYKWIAALAIIILVFIMLVAIRPVRAAIEHLID